MKLTLLRILNPFSLVQEYQRFGGIFTFHLQDVLKEVVVFPNYTRYLFALLIMLVYKTSISQSYTTKSKICHFSITQSCRNKLLHVRSLHATRPYHI